MKDIYKTFFFKNSMLVIVTNYSGIRLGFAVWWSKTIQLDLGFLRISYSYNKEYSDA